MSRYEEVIYISCASIYYKRIKKGIKEVDLKGMSNSHKVMKSRITITVDKELVDWADEQAKTLEFRSRSHVIEVAITRLKELKEKKG